MGAPALPIHDSFIIHHGSASELEENIKNEEDDIELRSLTFDEIIEVDKERAQWTKRSDLWFKTVNP